MSSKSGSSNAVNCISLTGMDKIKILFLAIASIKDGMLVLPLLKQNFYRQQWIAIVSAMLSLQDLLPNLLLASILNCNI
jgi:hypothetical protein